VLPQGQLTDAMVAAGFPAATPAAIVQSASTPQQRIGRATLGSLAATAEEQKLGAPSIVVVVAVVDALTPGAEALQWPAYEEQCITTHRHRVGAPGQPKSEAWLADRPQAANPTSN
jgi:siroheme synthase